MIERRKDGVDLGLHDGMDSRVVEYRLTWLTRLRVLLTGVVRVWRVS